MTNTEQLPEFLFSSYLNLAPPNPGAPLHTYGPHIACQEFIAPSGRQYTLTQRAMYPSFRSAVCRLARRDVLDVVDPIELPNEALTPEWAALREGIVRFSELSWDGKSRLNGILNKLCFYHTILSLSGAIDEAKIGTVEGYAEFAYTVASARFMQSFSIDNGFHPIEFQRIAEQAPSEGRAKALSCLHLIVGNARHWNDVDAVKIWSEKLMSVIRSDPKDWSDFTTALMWSRYFRAAGFYYQFTNQRELLIECMDDCEQYARELDPAAHPHGEILKAENLIPMLQSRSKEALWLGDSARAERYMLEAVEVDENDIRPWMELGQLYYSTERVELGVEAYLKATLLGPAGHEICYFMAGQGLEQLERKDLAEHCYLRAIELDSDGYSGLRRLKSLGGIEPELVAFAKGRLETLEAS